jgi:hypothetical protein
VKLCVHTVDGAVLRIEDFDAAGLMELLEAFSDLDCAMLALEMGDALVYLNRQNVVRIDVED